MTPHPAHGQTSHGTGDLNLAAALMAVGIPLEPGNECAAIHRDNGRSYGRWFVLPSSADGRLDTHKLMRAWSGLESLPPSHPFAWVMEFIGYGRRAGCREREDWIAAAHDHCRELGLPAAGLPRYFDQIPDLVASLPDARQSYVFAFIHCRRLALRLYGGQCRVQVMQSRGRSHSIIDARLPAPLRNELLARLEGS